MSPPCNKRKSARYLWSGLAISTIIGCASFVYISLHFGTANDSETPKHFSNNPEKLTDGACVPLCNSTECVAQSNYILNYIEPTVDPCENYFEFACGKFLGKLIRNESRNLFVDSVLELKLILKGILDGIEADSITARGKLKIVYDSCLKYGSSDIQAIPTLFEFLFSAGLPNWPNLDRNFQFKENSLANVLGKFQTYKEYGFVDVKRPYGYENGADRWISDSKFQSIISYTEGSYQKKEKLLRKYLIEKILTYFKLESAFIKEILEETEAINDAIIHLQEETNRRSGENDIPITCGHDTEERWKFACEVIESFIQSAGLNEDMSKQFAIISSDSIYFTENIFHVLKNFSDRSIANYLAFNVFFVHLDQLNFLFRITSQKDPDFFDMLFKRWKNLTPWQHCVDWLRENMFIPLTSEFIKEFTIEEIEEVMSLIQETIQEAADTMSTQDWITEPLRMEVVEKVKNIKVTLEDNTFMLMNETQLDALYEEFHPSNVSFLYNLFENNRFSKYEQTLERHKLFRLLRFPFESTFLYPGASGGAGYFDIQLASLLPPIYRSGLAKPFNILSLTPYIAHEIGHNLYFFSAKFEDPEAKNFMDNIFDCITNQYSQFKYEIIGKNMNISSWGSLGEDFSDTVAISILDNFIEKYSSSDDISLLPGLPYTAKQMFYISALELYCESDSEKDEIYNYENDDHSLGRFRMLGMIQNSKGFAKAFNCPEGSFMNPATKCSFPK